MTAATGAAGTATRLKAQGRALFSGFTTGQKAMTAIAVLAVVVGGYLFMTWAGTPSYQPLFSNLSATDASAITSKLSSSKVPYKLSDGGATVLVPAADVYQQRLNLSAAGLPGSSSSGYSLLDKAGVTSSQFQQQVDYQQAVQTELDHTIEAITGVTGAVVHVVIPTDTAFAGPTNSPSASVLVSLAPGVTLGPSQVQAIVHLVASSVENLDPSAVTVVDNRGDVLNAPGTDSAALAAGDAQDQQTQLFDQTLGSKLTAMLTPIVGPNNAVVTVSADLDYSQTQTTSKQYDPNKTGPVQVSTAQSSEQYTGTGGAAAAAGGGALGTTGTANGTAGTTTATPANGGTYNQTGSSSNSVVSEVDQTTQNAPGAIKRLSVAVVVNSSVKGVQTAQLQGVISSAAGLLPSRGDTISVASLPFDTTAQVATTKQLSAAAKAKSSSQMLSTARSALVLVVVLGLFVYALRKVTRTTRTAITLPDDWALGAIGPAGDEPTRVLAPVAAAPTTSLAPLAAVPAPVALSPGAALSQIADQDPAEIARLLRSWLAEEGR